MNNIIDQLKNKITGKGLKIVFPESHDERILKAALKLSNKNLIIPVLIGKVKDIYIRYRSVLLLLVYKAIKGWY